MTPTTGRVPLATTATTSAAAAAAAHDTTVRCSAEARKYYKNNYDNARACTTICTTLSPSPLDQVAQTAELSF